MRQLFNFLLKYYFFILFVVLEVFAFIMIANNNYYQEGRMLNTANQLTGSVYQYYNNIFDYFNLKETNRQLAAENAILHAQIDNSFVKITNKIFSKGDTTYKQQYQYVDAKIISSSTGKRNNYLMLNKGFEQGIRNDMAVISPTGIVGIVNGVSNNYCSVMSVLHSEIKITAKVKKNNYLGTVVWEGGSYKTGTLVDIPSHVVINKGDTIITSGHSLDFPEGIPIGTIADYRVNQGDNTYRISINFLADYKKLDYVYVIRNLFKEEQLKLKELQHE